MIDRVPAIRQRHRSAIRHDNGTPDGQEVEPPNDKGYQASEEEKPEIRSDFRGKDSIEQHDVQSAPASSWIEDARNNSATDNTATSAMISQNPIFTTRSGPRSGK